MAVLWLSAPDVPVAMIVDVPIPAALVVAVNVTTLVVFAGFGEKVAVKPSGSPIAAKVTLPSNPLTGVIVIVLLTLAPWLTLTFDGEADIEKSGAALALLFQKFTKLAASTEPQPVARS